MNDLMILMAGMLPFELLLDKMEQAIKEYKETGSDESKKQIGFYAMMISGNEIVSLRMNETGKNIEDSTLDVLKDVQRIKKADDLLKTNLS